MTILQELARLYDRRPDLPRPGYSSESIGAEVVLSADGALVDILPLMAVDENGKMRPRLMPVPAAIKRTAGIKPNLFWDKSAYVLGITAAMGEDGKPLLDEGGNPVPSQGRRTAEEHAAFVSTHLELLSGSDVAGLIALYRFLERWQWTDFAAQGLSGRHIDQNLVFRLEGERRFLHDLPEAGGMFAAPDAEGVICLVSGKEAPVARLHPSIKGVVGAQSTGASLVSFNERAYESHGKKQGGNAPVSEAAAFAYGTALNALLARESGQNMRIGDTTVVSWAEAATAEATEAANALWSTSLAPKDDDAALRKLSGDIEAIAKGHWHEVPDFDPETRIFALGLAPNAARLSVRFWHSAPLQDFAARIALFWKEIEIEPSPWRAADAIKRPPAVSRLLYEVAARGEAKNIPPLLGGGLMRSVLAGTPYPRTLLSGLIGRIRAEGMPPDRFSDGRRAALIRAVVVRNTTEEVPLALDKTADDIAYLLGRLFGAYTYAERSYANRGTTIRDKYLGSASATPARIFPTLMRGYEHNRATLARAGGYKARYGAQAERAIAQILSIMPDGGELPISLPLEDQGRFFVGFYHQLSSFYAKAGDAGIEYSMKEEAE